MNKIKKIDSKYSPEFLHLKNSFNKNQLPLLINY